VASSGPRTRYAVVIRLPREVEVQIEDTYLSVLGATKPSMGYHLTLLGPYCLAPNAPSPFLPSLARVCRNAEPITVHLRGLGAYRTENNSAVYLRVVDAAPVIELHKRLLEATARQILAENEQLHVWTVEKYDPHVTLGLGMSDTELEEFMRLGERRDLEVAFEAQTIWLVAQASNGPWEYVAEYPLGVHAPESDGC